MKPTYKRHNNFFIVGPSGVGKTKLAKGLAKRLNLTFIDSDNWIVQHYGMPISEIFKRKGEPFFRTLEHQFLIDFSFENTVVSTGGGMACSAANMGLINQKSTSVFIMRNIGQIAQHLMASKTPRPLMLPAQKSSEIVLYIERQLNLRLRHYKQAHLFAYLKPYEYGKQAIEKIVHLITK